MCTVEVKLKLFETYCSPMYCAHSWWNFRKETMNRLIVSYHNLLKRIIGLSKYESASMTCAFFRVQNCESVLRKLTYKFLERVDNSTDSIIEAINTSDLYYKSKIRCSWWKKIYTNGALGQNGSVAKNKIKQCEYRPIECAIYAVNVDNVCTVYVYTFSCTLIDVNDVVPGTYALSKKMDYLTVWNTSLSIYLSIYISR